MKLLLLDTLLSAALFPFVLGGLRALRSWPRPPFAPPPSPESAPFVTICVPARDEERSIEACVRSLLGQDYPANRCEVVVVDDRSTDATPAILARLRAQDERLHVHQGAPLPNGWQGKCWALHQAVQCANPAATFLLFTDADTVHDPRMLSSVVSFAEDHGIDLLSLGPDQELGTESERVLLPMILALSVTANGTLAEVNDPTRVDVAKAVGQFILFRASAYGRIGGHEAVRAEIVEDFAIARVAKNSGCRLLLADGRHLVRTRMYRSAREIWDGLSKNTFDEVQRHPGGALVALLGLPLLAAAPYVLALVGAGRLRRRARPSDAMLLLQSKAQCLALLAVGRAAASAWHLPARYGLAQPIASLFLWGIMANSTWRNVSGRGVVWKGRTY